MDISDVTSFLLRFSENPFIELFDTHFRRVLIHFVRGKKTNIKNRFFAAVVVKAFIIIYALRKVLVKHKVLYNIFLELRCIHS